jgi:hypothetical protein
MRNDLDVSDQELFDRMVTHMRAQRTTAVLSGTSAYHGLDNRRCPVGAIIPDDLYDPRMEGISIGGLGHASWIKPELRTFLRQHHRLLGAMQDVHDTVPPVEWEKYFHLIATNYDLLLDGKATLTALDD